MVRVYREGWQGTESWCFVGLSATGENLGQVRLPLDFWAGGGYAVTPDGRILEQRSTEKGIILTTYELQP